MNGTQWRPGCVSMAVGSRWHLVLCNGGASELLVLRLSAHKSWCAHMQSCPVIPLGSPTVAVLTN